jgi:hypothetical protein
MLSRPPLTRSPPPPPVAAVPLQPSLSSSLAEPHSPPPPPVAATLSCVRALRLCARATLHAGPLPGTVVGHARDAGHHAGPVVVGPHAGHAATVHMGRCPGAVVGRKPPCKPSVPLLFHWAARGFQPIGLRLLCYFLYIFKSFQSSKICVGFI